MERPRAPRINFSAAADYNPAGKNVSILGWEGTPDSRLPPNTAFV